MSDEEPRRLIWDCPAPATRAPAPSLNRDQVAREAVRVADAAGIEAVSMRRVALVLDVGTASLYRYVDDTDELIELMIDHTEGEDGSPGTARQLAARPLNRRPKHSGRHGAPPLAEAGCSGPTDLRPGCVAVNRARVRRAGAAPFGPGWSVGGERGADAVRTRLRCTRSR